MIIECSAKGKIIPSISIKKGTQDIILSQRVILEKRVEPEQWEQYLTLTLKKAFMTDAGEYRCIAENGEGTAIHSMFLDGKSKPISVKRGTPCNLWLIICFSTVYF